MFLLDSGYCSWRGRLRCSKHSKRRASELAHSIEFVGMAFGPRFPTLWHVYLLSPASSHHLNHINPCGHVAEPSCFGCHTSLLFCFPSLTQLTRRVSAAETGLRVAGHRSVVAKCHRGATTGWDKPKAHSAGTTGAPGIPTQWHTQWGLEVIATFLNPCSAGRGLLL